MDSSRENLYRSSSVQEEKTPGMSTRFYRSVFFVAAVAAFVPSAIFIYMSYGGLNKILTSLDTAQSTTTQNYLSKLSERDNGDALLSEIIVAHLEYDTLRNRQLRGNSLLATRTWLRFMSSVFGSILVFIGAIFLLSKIEFGVPTSIEGKADIASFSIKSTSPGIIMIAIGAVLMIVPNIAKQDIGVTDGSVYYETKAEEPADIRPSQTPLGRATIEKFMKE